jgi:hypothetical protein
MSIASLPNRKSILEYYRPMADRTPQIRPIIGVLGAQIPGPGLAEHLVVAAIAALRLTWLHHLVIFRRVMHFVTLASDQSR